MLHGAQKSFLLFAGGRKLCTWHLVKQIANTDVAFELESTISAFRTSINNPTDLDLKQEGQFYKVPPEIVKMLDFTHKLPPPYQKQELKTRQSYDWSKRDSVPAGVSLIEIVDNGINRIRYATDCVGVLLKELKYYASKGRIKIVVTIDEANSLFHSTLIEREDKSYAPATDVSLNRHFSKLLRNDWNNGIAVIALDEKEVEGKFKETSHLPYFLLGKEAFDLLDPFVPIETVNYSEKEIVSCLDYYFDRNWITTSQGRSREGRKQLTYLSDFNPHLLERLCAVW